MVPAGFKKRRWGEGAALQPLPSLTAQPSHHLVTAQNSHHLVTAQRSQQVQSALAALAAAPPTPLVPPRSWCPDALNLTPSHPRPAAKAPRECFLAGAAPPSALLPHHPGTALHGLPRRAATSANSPPARHLHSGGQPLLARSPVLRSSGLEALADFSGTRSLDSSARAPCTARARSGASTHPSAWDTQQLSRIQGLPPLLWGDAEQHPRSSATALPAVGHSALGTFLSRNARLVAEGSQSGTGSFEEVPMPHWHHAAPGLSPAPMGQGPVSRMQRLQAIQREASMPSAALRCSRYATQTLLDAAWANYTLRNTAMATPPTPVFTGRRCVSDVSLHMLLASSTSGSESLMQRTEQVQLHAAAAGTIPRVAAPRRVLSECLDHTVPSFGLESLFSGPIPKEREPASVEARGFQKIKKHDLEGQCTAETQPAAPKRQQRLEVDSPLMESSLEAHRKSWPKLFGVELNPVL